MPTYAQLAACNPQAFVEAGTTYQRMAQGFGRVQQVFSRGIQVLDADWAGAAKDLAMRRGRHLDGGLVAGGQEANQTGQVLVTLGRALTAAQGSLRAAVATAHGVGLIVTPTGDVINPNPVYNQPGNAMLGPVRAMIAAAVAAGTAADTAAAGKIGVLAAGKLVTAFGSQGGSTAAVVQQVAAVATAPSTSDAGSAARTIARRLASTPDFGRLGSVDRGDIDRVVAPTGVIGADGLAAWTARRRAELGDDGPDPARPG